MKNLIKILTLSVVALAAHCTLLAGEEKEVVTMDDIVEAYFPSNLCYAPDSLANFPGGKEAYRSWFYSHAYYPEEALEKGEQGTAIVRVGVGTDGKVFDARTVRSSRSDALDEAAEELFRYTDMTWNPAQKDGKPVDSYLFIPMGFTITESKELSEDYGGISPEQFDKYSGLGRQLVTEIVIVDDEGNEIDDDNTAHIGVIDSSDEDMITKAEPASIYSEYEVDIPASFPGGLRALSKWLSTHLRYPEDAMEYGAQGKVLVEFVIDEEGAISDVFTAEGVWPSLDAEAERVVKIMPRWDPATINGKKVKCSFMLPVSFALHDLEGGLKLYKLRR